MNKNIFKGKWDQLKGSVKQTWGDLNDDDLKKVQGQMEKLVGIIQEKYGEAKDDIEDKLDDLLKKMK